MAINFPTSLDNFTNPSSGNTLDSPSHSLQHSDINDAVEALEAKLGIGVSPAGSASAGQVLTISAAGTSTWSTPTAPGLVQITPSSVTVGSGSSSVNANGQVSFSGASSVTLNNIFSSTYDNYKIVYSELKGSTGTTIRGRLGVAGTPKTASYYYGAWLVNHVGSTSTGSGNNQGSIFLNEVASGSANVVGMEITFFNPNKASLNTTYNYQGFCAQQLRMHVGSGNIDDSSQMTDFQIFPDSGNLTGLVSIYGFRN